MKSNYLLTEEHLSIYPSGPWDMESRLSLLSLLNPCLETAQILELFLSRPIYSSTWGSGLYSHFHIIWLCVCTCVCLKAKRRREEGEGNARPKAKEEKTLMQLNWNWWVYTGESAAMWKRQHQKQKHINRRVAEKAPPPFKSRNPVHPRLILR